MIRCSQGLVEGVGKLKTHCLFTTQVREPALTKNDRKKFNTVLIIEVHARDIIDSFVRDRCVCISFRRPSPKLT